MNKEFIVVLNVEEEDFCGMDLSEIIKDGFDNVGNHTLIDVVAVADVEINKKEEIIKKLLELRNELSVDKFDDFMIELNEKVEE